MNQLKSIESQRNIELYVLRFAVRYSHTWLRYSCYLLHNSSLVLSQLCCDYVFFCSYIRCAPNNCCNWSRNHQNNEFTLLSKHSYAHCKELSATDPIGRNSILNITIYRCTQWNFSTAYLFRMLFHRFRSICQHHIVTMTMTISAFNTWHLNHSAFATEINVCPKMLFFILK